VKEPKWVLPKVEKIPVYETVNDTKLARKMYPEFEDNNDGTITIITGYKNEEPVILSLSEGFTYTGTPKK